MSKQMSMTNMVHLMNQGQQQTDAMERAMLVGVECSNCGVFICMEHREISDVLGPPVCGECIKADASWHDRMAEEMDERIEDAFLRECYED